MRLRLFLSFFLWNRKDTNNLQNVGTAASKLLYTLHWTLLDAAEECADADREAGIAPREPFPYIFPLTCIQVFCFFFFFLFSPQSFVLTFSSPIFQEFVYLFAPLRHLLKEADLQNFRLENGLKIWPALWDYRHPNAQCFTAPVRPKKCSSGSRKKTAAGSSSSASGIAGAHAPPPVATNPPVLPPPTPLPRETVTFNDVFIGKVNMFSALVMPLYCIFQSRTCTF